MLLLVLLLLVIQLLPRTHLRIIEKFNVAAQFHLLRNIGATRKSIVDMKEHS